ncbi:hypothetical protein POM88_017617 [Heracleum sosnowskyi]|uniref:Uncharacterized protein n=1 Tax=Heracleum sosnowskyi TaxID=360622 RepID=A0AAD8INX7_9APIA|nr:hypothetical protein POM88_017617 [Heracleum sosnowskyi]
MNNQEFENIDFEYKLFAGFCILLSDYIPTHYDTLKMVKGLNDNLCCKLHLFISSTVSSSFLEAMKIYFLIVSVLVLSSRLSTVKGLRLGKSSEGHDQKFQGKSSEVVQRVKDVVINVAADVREEAHSSSEGMNRKLMLTKTTPASIIITTSSKVYKQKPKGKPISSKEASGNEHFTVKTSPVSEQVVDMVEMDYSPAKKRSPIHN